MTNTKKAIFIIIGLAIITTAFFFSKSSVVHAAKKEGTKFDDWVVTCTPKNGDDKTPQTCFLTQQINVGKDDKRQVLALYQVGYFGDNKELKIIQTLPLGVSVEAGTSIISSGNMVAQGKYTTCTQAGCQALANISDDELKKIISNDENSVAFMNVEGKQINIPLSNKGLKKGLAFLRK